MSKAIDIIIPMYNRADLIGETLQSLIDQTNPNWNAYVVDDGSTDGSKEVAQQFADQADGRIHVVDRPDHHLPGGSGARNYGASLSDSDWLMFLDSDDFLGAEALRVRAAHIESHSEMDMIVFPSAMFHSKPGDSIKTWRALHSSETDLIRFLKFDIPWLITGPVWKRSAFLSIGGFNETAKTQQDWEIHTRALLEGLRVYKVDDIDENRHFYYRMPIDRESISVGRFDTTFVKNKLNVYESIREKYTSRFPLLRRYLLRKYFLDYIELTEIKRYADAQQYKEVAYSFGIRGILIWNINLFINKLARYELLVYGRLPVPKLINRFYNWRIMDKVFFKKGRYVGQH